MKKSSFNICLLGIFLILLQSKSPAACQETTETEKKASTTVSQSDSSTRDKLVQARKTFRNAKKIVFLGDSNTHAGGYINFINAALLNSLPKVPEVINLGLPSETCCGLSEPIHPFPRPNVQDRLVAALEKSKPDLVFACYGMNDGIYHPFDEGRYLAFQNGVRRIINECRQRKIELFLLTPPPFDPLPGRNSGKLVPKDSPEFSWKTVYENYDDEVIKTYAQWMTSLEEPGCFVIDIHTPLNKYVASKRETQLDFAFSKDGVHFDQDGHRILASIILDQLLPSYKHCQNKEVLALVRRRHAVSHAAWLTFVGHKRPGVKPGLPMKEAKKQMDSLSDEIHGLLSK